LKKESSKNESIALFRLVATVSHAFPVSVDSSPSIPHLNPVSVPGYFEICPYILFSASSSSVHAPLVDNTFLAASVVSLHENPPASPEQNLTSSFKRSTCSSQFFPSTTPIVFDESAHANLACVSVVTVLVTVLEPVLVNDEVAVVVNEDVLVLVRDDVAVDEREVVAELVKEEVTVEDTEVVTVDVAVVLGLVTSQLMKIPSASLWIALFNDAASFLHASSVSWWTIKPESVYEKSPILYQLPGACRISLIILLTPSEYAATSEPVYFIIPWSGTAPVSKHDMTF